MSGYFNYLPNRSGFPITFKTVDNRAQQTVLCSFPDLFRHAALVAPNAADGDFFYERAVILDGERPEQLSTRLYGSPEYFWTFFVLNDKMRLGESLQWPLSDSALERKIDIEFDGLCITSYKSRYIAGFLPGISYSKKNNRLYSTFSIGQRVVGQISGTTATIINIRPEYGQTIVSDIESNSSDELAFMLEEGIQGLDENGETTGEEIICDELTRTQFAIYRYIEPATGRYVDNRNFILTDETNTTSGLETITFREHVINQNESLRTIRVLRNESITKFAETFRNLLARRSHYIEGARTIAS